MDNSRDLCARLENEWDVFIAYYGDEQEGTQRQAEALHDALNGAPLVNGHKLHVYQHTRSNPGGRFGATPDNVKRSRIFLMLVDKKVPREPSGSLLEKDKNGLMKRLYEEAVSFRDSYYYRSYFNEAVCSVIICDDMPFTQAEALSTIFGGQPALKWSELINASFLPLLKQISRFLIGSEDIPTTDPVPVTLPHTVSVEAARGDITIGAGAKERLLRLPSGKRAPYERLVDIKELSQGREDNHFIDFLTPIETPFVPDAEVYADCERILASLECADSLSVEETVFLRFIHDIRAGRKESRQVARISSIDPINTYGRFRVRLQPIEYLWIMRMTMLDTPFNDGKSVTTLRKKYANPIEDGEAFRVADRLACHSGCGVFIITSDGYLVYQNRFEAQKNRVSFFPGKLSYTVSGSYLFNGGSIFDFMNEKIERELGFLSHDLYLWELGYEYDYLHYQFSFFAFCDETRDEFIEYTNPRSAQAKSYSFYDLRDCMSIASTLQPEHWESSAWAVLSSALMSHLFRRLLKQRCGIEFDQGSFRQFFRPSH